MPYLPKHMVYAGIFRGGAEIAESGPTPKSARTFAQAVANTANQAKMSFTCEQMGAHSLALKNGDTAVIVCEINRPRRKAFALLADIEAKLERSSGPTQTVLDDALEEFSWEDPITETQAEIDEVRTIMIENVDKLLERGERIGLLVDRTQELSTGAHTFRKQATNVRVRFWWKNVRMLLLLILLLAALTFFIYLIV